MEQFIVDAWIDKVNPRIRLTNRDSSVRIAEWAVDRARALLSEGVVTVSELYSTEPSVQAQIAKDLLLVACKDSLCSCEVPGTFQIATKPLLMNYSNVVVEKRAA